MTSAPVVVEFVGLPGSGKTTNIPYLRSSFAARGVDTLTAIRLRHAPSSLEQRGALGRALVAAWLGQHRIRSLIRHRVSTKTAIWALVRSHRAIGDKWNTFRRFAVTLDNYGSVRCHGRSHASPNVVILNEGIAQSAFKLFANAPHDAAARPAEWTAYIECVPLPDFLIYLRVEPTTCLERLRERRPIGVPRRFVGLEPAAQEEAFRVGSRILDDVVTGMRRRGCTVLEVPTDPRSRRPRDGFWDEVAGRIAAASEGRASGSVP